MGEEWIVEMRKKRELLDVKGEEEILEKTCIFRVPNFIRKHNSNIYTPQVVSLGPYHHHHQETADCCDPLSLKKMEPIKHKILIGLLALKGSVELEDVVEAMKEEVRELMDAYDGLEEQWTDENRFTELMILDGCFVLATLLIMNDKVNKDDPNHSLLLVTLTVILSVSQEATADMLLLENQVPFRAVHILADLLIPQGMIGNDSLEDLTLDIFVYQDVANTEKKSYHMLDLIRKGTLLNKDFIFKGKKNMGTATELIKNGVTFERSDNYEISFSNGVFKICLFHVLPHTGCLYANTMAYEKMKDLKPQMLALLGFMDCLINTADDVTLLRGRGIIYGWLGSDEQVAWLFNHLVKEVPPPYYYELEDEGIDEQVIEYCSKRRHRWWASFKQLYLENPWVFISMLGGIILLILTLLQVVYQMLDYYSP